MLQDGPDIVSFGFWGLSLTLVTDSTLAAELKSRLHLSSRNMWEISGTAQHSLVAMTLPGDLRVHFGR